MSWPKGKSRGPISDEHRKKIRGSKNGQAKLTKEQVRDEILPRLAEGESICTLGEEFGVSHTAIWMIREGRTWRFLQEEGGDKQ